jgi:hypothetical protein
MAEVDVCKARVDWCLEVKNDIILNVYNSIKSKNSDKNSSCIVSESNEAVRISEGFILCGRGNSSVINCISKLCTSSSSCQRKCSSSYDEVFLGYQLGQMVEWWENQHFEDHLCPHPQGEVFKTLVFSPLNHLTWLIAWENFIILSPRKQQISLLALHVDKITEECFKWCLWAGHVLSL